MEEKKEKALEVAREYFHKFGYRKASLSDLIEEIGISKPTFYNYFKNKEELFYAVMLATYNEFHYQYSQQEKSAANALEKLQVYIETFAWFLDKFPIYRDLYKAGNDLMAKWAQSRYSKDFFSEGVDAVASILEEGVQEGIFSKDLDVGKNSLVIYYVVLSALSTDPEVYQKTDQAEYRIDVQSLIKIIGHGLLVRSDQ